MPTIRAFGSRDASTPLALMTIERRDPLPRDVVIDITHCGVCHSDLHQARDEWKSTTFPCVPGHEIVGRVVRVGSEVKRFRVGDAAAVGCMVDSCRDCESCAAGLEQYCARKATFTYNSDDPHGGGITMGGYSQSIVVTEDFVLRLPEGMDLAAAAPLLCAGITTWSPLRRFEVGAGSRVGIVGLGGLGHMAVKLANALGAHVVLFTTSPGKTEDALRLGASEVCVSKDETAMTARAGTLDFILDTVSAQHDLGAYLALLKRSGTMVLVGAPEEPLAVPAFSLIFGAKRLAGSLIGGIAETQEMLDFCGERGITSDVEVIAMKDINSAYDRLLRSDVRYRFVIDMSTLR